MEGTCIINGQKCVFKLNSTSLSYSRINEDLSHKQIKTNFTIALRSVLHAEYFCNVRPCVRVDYVVQQADNKMRRETLEVEAEETVCLLLEGFIREHIDDFPRPKNLLVFVNPQSGHRKGVHLYRSKVEPMFNQYGIKTTTVYTTRAGQPKELLKTYDLSLINGIVSVGGDGMFSECVNGLLLRLQQDSNIDPDNPEADIRASRIPIGIVPTGSGNYLVNYIHGTRDLETAVLKIILGDHHMSNVVSVHQGRKLSCYASLLAEFGLIGNMMHDCEKFRWMGPSRYKVIPLKSLLQRKSVNVEVDYIPEQQTKERLYSRQISIPAKNFARRFFKERINSFPDGFMASKNQDWQSLRGRVYGVDTYVVTQKERGDHVVPSFGDSALTLWLTQKCKMVEHVEQLTRKQKAQSGFLDYDFIQKVRTTRYRIRLSDAKTYTDENGERKLVDKFFINADGEAILLESPEAEIKLHTCAMPIYGKMDG